MDNPPNDMHLDGDALCDYAEGLLEGPARARAEIHLRGCATCRKEADALRGYFREMAGLEPAQAPPDFLAKVHARLPRPSPWKKALSALSRPWRAIPVQIAFLTLLGVTGITAYLYQSGGMESHTVPLSAPKEAEALTKESAPAGEAPASEAPASKAPVRQAPASGAAVSRDQSRETPRPRAKAHTPAPAAPAAKPRSVPPPASAPARSASEALSKRRAAPEADGYSEEANPGYGMLADAGARREIRIRMAGQQDTAALLAGLRAMGTETTRYGTGDGEYLLRMPASRLAGTRTYLEGYGSIQGTDAPEPDSAASPISVLLRIFPPDP